MENDFEKGFIDGFKKETECAIEQAWHGQLSPYWQEYAHRELSDFRANHTLADTELSLLEERLNEAISSRAQISDEAYSRKQIEENGGELLYYFGSNDHSTIMEVVRNGSVYTACAYIDADGARGHLESYCTNMKEHFLAWVDTLGLAKPIVPDTVPQERLHYDSLEDALRFVVSILAHPAEYVI